MKRITVNEGRHGVFGDIWAPDTIAAWDAIHHWERERLGSMADWLEPGMSLVDVGTEHAWLTAVYGQFVGPENVVLCEPSPEMWQDIWLTWTTNEFPEPLGIWPGFVGAKDSIGPRPDTDAAFARLLKQWPAWTGEGVPESEPVPYRNLNDHAKVIMTITLDTISHLLGPLNAITIDVEGAELEVMRGAERVLKVDRPLVWISEHADLIERDFGHNLHDLHELMDRFGYRRQFLGVDHEAHALYTPKRVWR